MTESPKTINIAALLEAQKLLQSLFQYKSDIREREMVLEALEAITDNRKCFRLTNGLLMQYQRSEIIDQLKKEVETYIQLQVEVEKELEKLEKSSETNKT